MDAEKKENQIHDNSREVDRSTFGLAWILAALVAVLLGLVLVYMRQGSQGSPEQVSDTVAEAAAPAPDQEQPAQEPAEQEAESKAAATQVMTELKRFQDATERGMDYTEYDKKLDSLKADLDNTLPSFGRHNPGDEIFRQEVAGALRDYTAAKNWWKTTITNSNVFTEADRNERTQKNWESARTHLTTAEKLIR